MKIKLSLADLPLRRLGPYVPTVSTYPTPHTQGPD